MIDSEKMMVCIERVFRACGLDPAKVHEMDWELVAAAVQAGVDLKRRDDSTSRAEVGG